MKQFLTAHPRDKHGLHNYSLEDFGLNDAEINDLFEEYNRFLEKL